MSPLFRYVPIGLFSALVIGSILIAASGPAPQLIFPADTANYLDGTYRLFLRQELGGAFSSPIGPAAYIPTVIATHLIGPEAKALAFGAAIANALFGLFSWRVAITRMHVVPAALFTLLVANTASASYTLDFGSWNILSYGMLYNRYAWAICMTAAAAAILPDRTKQKPLLAGAGWGTSASLLALIKPNYLVIFGLFYAVSLWTSPRRLSFLLATLTGTALSLPVIYSLTPFSLSGYIHTLFGMAHGAPADLLRYTLVRSLQENLLPLTLLFSVCLIMAHHKQLPHLTFVFITASTFATFLANTTNCQFSEIPLWGAFACICLQPLLDAKPSSTRTFACLVLLGLAFAFIWKPIASTLYIPVRSVFRSSSSKREVSITTPSLRALPMLPMPGQLPSVAGPLEIPANFALWLSDGIRLLTPYLEPDTRILCLDWNNPFPFAPVSIPPPHDCIAWHYGRTHSDQHHPDPALLLQTADIVMEPHRSLQPESLEFKRRLFGPGLYKSFFMAAESNHWRLWMRKK